ncbi:hypothetical protein PhaeoP70_00187 [Phaeobacter inhibens]|nr:hypothetical protein PhaeoP92_00187 [Phaeobacter inhibens]AUQ76914.1 hypothetical protein PhaeoP74_00189 [Phaeobacter inhibens]AUR14073.1 hypothetical protein PhaeoP70_00187 [Phaeobacter inhibens]
MKNRLGLNQRVPLGYGGGPVPLHPQAISYMTSTRDWVSDFVNLFSNKKPF